MNPSAWLARAARADPRAVAIYRGTRPWVDYGGLALRAGRIAAGLRRRGLVPGDRVALFMANTPEYLEALYGIWWAGLVAVPVNAKLHARELEFITADSGAREVIDDRAQVGGLAAADPMPPATTLPADLAWLFYTSGTTGRPKGAMLSVVPLV